MAPSAELLAQLDSISDAKSPEQLARLERATATLKPESCGREEFRALLGVLERFPLDDGLESFWSIVHLLEACEGYEPYLVASVSRRPAELTLTMLSRLLNAGLTHCGDISYASMLASAATDTSVAPELRVRAAHLLEHQGMRASGA